MSCSARFHLVVIFLIAVAVKAVAHQVPSLTVEAEFGMDGAYTLRVNVDPRLFLSDRPSELPPVPVEWYRDQSEAELAATRRSAQAYLARALTLVFSDKNESMPSCTFLPMDGATNMPLDVETREVHLLARCSARVPEGGRDFKLALGKDANVSMILLNSLAGKAERRPQVLFPGETSRAFRLVAESAAPSEPPAPAVAPVVEPAPEARPPAAEAGSQTSAPQPASEEGEFKWSRVVVLVLLFAIVVAVRWVKGAGPGQNR